MSSRPVSGRIAQPVVIDGLVLVGLLALAAVLRLPGLEVRGEFDADQGRIMLALERWLRDGEVPLLGPPASIGGVHHGALFYYLLAPAAVLGGLEPGAVVTVVALAGIATVGLVWFAARSIGGRSAGFVAGLLTAVSATEVARSTSLWNPGIVPLGAALTLAAGWTAWSRRCPAAWLAAGAGSTLALQGHLLSALVIVPLWALALADLRRSRGRARRRLSQFLAGALGIVALSYVPLLASELGSNFAEVRALLTYAAGVGAETSGAGELPLPVIVAIRTASWSLVGLVTRAPALAITTTAALATGTIWAAVRLGHAASRTESAELGGAKTDPDLAEQRTAIRWLGGSLLVAVTGLTLAAPGLGSVVEVLPVDQYHAAADPLVLVLAGLLTAALARGVRRATTGDRAAQRPSGLGVWLVEGGAAVAVGGLVLWNLAGQPPAPAPDGSWPAARAAASRVSMAVPSGEAIVLRSLPSFTAPDAYTFALHAAGRTAVGPSGAPSGPDSNATVPSPAPATALVVVCHERLVPVAEPGCGGPAERAWLDGRGWRLIDRFAAAPDRVLSVYLPSDAP